MLISELADKLYSAVDLFGDIEVAVCYQHNDGYCMKEPTIRFTNDNKKMLLECNNRTKQ